jgi:hypothetical protein
VDNDELGMVPTKYGIALNVDEWAQLNETMDTLNGNLQVMSESLTRQKKCNESKQTKEPSTELKHYSKKSKKNFQKPYVKRESYGKM